MNDVNPEKFMQVQNVHQNFVNPNNLKQGTCRSQNSVNPYENCLQQLFVCLFGFFLNTVIRTRCLLVFRRKDLCEAKHDVWCSKFC